jgi:hypothetical protein
MKLIPFKCKFGHITIRECTNPTPSKLICERCLKEIEEGKLLVADSRRTFSYLDITAKRI